MQKTITKRSIISYLRKNYQAAGFVDSLKIKYRSLICPFVELIGLVKPGDNVGDIGCGSGQFMFLIAHFAKPASIFGIEISNRLVNNANTLFKSAGHSDYEFIKYDGIHFPDQLANRDIIFLVDVLHHIPAHLQDNFLTALIQKMKPGARFVLKDIDAGSRLVYLNKLHDLVVAREVGNEISFSDAKKIIENKGLKILHEDKRTMYVYPHYTIVAQK